MKLTSPPVAAEATWLQQFEPQTSAENWSLVRKKESERDGNHAHTDRHAGLTDAEKPVRKPDFSQPQPQTSAFACSGVGGYSGNRCQMAGVLVTLKSQCK